EAKEILANEATKICHGEEASKSSELSSTKIFNDNSLDDSIPEKHILKINKKEIAKGTYLKEVLLKIFLSNSIGESKRLISNGGVKINDVKILDKEHLITINDFNQTNFCKITIGKKRHGMIEVIK
ncbi:MAG: tyrosine--tRNA ligase, partial [Rickettsiales bacterium]